MTTVLIQITSFFKSGKSPKLDAFWQKLAHNYMKNIPNLDEVSIQAPASSDFGLEARILQIADFIGQNEKFSKNQHRKINIPSSFVFQIEASKVPIQRKK